MSHQPGWHGIHHEFSSSTMNSRSESSDVRDLTRVRGVRVDVGPSVKLPSLPFFADVESTRSLRMNSAMVFIPRGRIAACVSLDFLRVQLMSEYAIA
jgi:hypothetical protein